MKITVRYKETEQFADPYRRWAGTIKTTTVEIYHDGKLFTSEEFVGGKHCNAVKEYVKKMKNDNSTPYDEDEEVWKREFGFYDDEEDDYE